MEVSTLRRLVKHHVKYARVDFQLHSEQSVVEHAPLENLLLQWRQVAPHVSKARLSPMNGKQIVFRAYRVQRNLRQVPANVMNVLQVKFKVLLAKDLATNAPQECTPVQLVTLSVNCVILANMLIPTVSVTVSNA